jgi:hypothetical protein
MINKTRLMKRAWSAYNTKVAKFNCGKIKNMPKFGSCLKWSWKIEKEEQNCVSYRDWSPASVRKIAGKDAWFRRYFNDNSYIKYELTVKGYYELTEVSGGVAAEMAEDMIAA